MPVAEREVALREQQFALSRHLRDPAAAAPPPGIEERRLAIYRDLLYNNLQGLLAGNFPVIRSTLGEDAWQRMVRAFFAGHRSHTPLFTEIGREFVRWLEATPGDGRDTPPWLAELAHYEWVELALQISDAQPPAGIDAGGDLLDRIPVVSPQAWPLAYRWPVHRIGPDHRPLAPPPQPTLLLVRRDDAGEVRFAELSPLAFRLLELLAERRCSGRDSLRALADEAGVALPALLAEGEALLQRMRDEGTLLGTLHGAAGPPAA